MSETPDSSRNIATVERLINAPASAIFDLLADPSRHQEIDGSGTVKGVPDGAAGKGSQRLSLGSKFGMSMKMGIGYTMENTVVEFEENVRIAWQPRPTQSVMAWFIGGRIWRYQLIAQGDSTLVRESWDISQEKQPWAVRSLRSKTVDSMTKTLERIAHVVEA